MASGKTEKFYLLGIGKDMRRRFIAVNLRLKLLSAFISISNVLNFHDFSHNI